MMNSNGFVKIRFPKCIDEIIERKEQRMRLNSSLDSSNLPIQHNLNNLIKSVGFIEKLPEYSTHILR